MSLNNSEHPLKYSVVVPVFNEARNLAHLYERLTRVFKQIIAPYEIIFVDDGSLDHSYAILRDIALKDRCVTVLSFVKNRGQHYAVVAGLLHARGDYVITLDSDLQNPPEEIPKLLEKAKEGFDMVSGYRKMRKDSLLRKLSSFMVNIIIWVKTGLRMKDYGSMLRVFKKETARAISDEFIKTEGYITMLIASVTRDVAEIEVNHDARGAGQSKYNLSKLIAFVIKIITHKEGRFRECVHPEKRKSIFPIKRVVENGTEKVV